MLLPRTHPVADLLNVEVAGTHRTLVLWQVTIPLNKASHPIPGDDLLKLVVKYNANSVKSDAYVVSNLRAGYTGRFGGVEIGPFIGFNNLFGEEYDDNLRLNARFSRTFEPAPKFNLYGGLTLAYHFGRP